MSADPVTQPLSETFGLAAMELVELVLMSEGLERMISGLVGRGGHVGQDLLTEAQAADLLSQRLAGVAAFMFGLAHVAPEVQVDVRAAASGLSLAAQARRLCGDAAVAAPADEDFLLFAD